MIRSFFLAMGISAFLLGFQCLGVSQFTLRLREDPAPSSNPFDFTPRQGEKMHMNPPSWGPWVLMATGTVVCIYSFTLPARASK